MALFGRGSIRRRVMNAMETRIEKGQEEFEQLARDEDERFADGVRALSDACLGAKIAAENRIVSSIIN